MDFTRDLAGLSNAQAAVLEALLRDAAQDGRNNIATTTAPGIIPIKTCKAGTPLFVIHGSGGQVLFLHALARHMSPTQPLHGMEAAPQADDAQPGCGRYVDALRAVQPHGPYRLGGYSAGCLIAFEVAARLRQAGEEVAFLLLIDPVSVPGAPAPARPTAPQRLRRR